MKTFSLSAAGVMLAVLSTAACARAPDAAAPSAATPAARTATKAAGPAATSAQAPRRGRTSASLPPVTVHKSPTCGCCTLWVEHLRRAGFQVSVHETDALEPIKQRLGVPYGKGSCHTAEVAGYVVEGHVPAEDIKRLLREKPKARGLVLPGMPLGSPGMEVPDGRRQTYTVELARPDGSTVPFAKH
ncbi:MAG TPA: DUF411 domain-containing protein [Lysobacter sp.]|nr:DUF411 domain-containing protein [Lysobacter sp.]